MTKYREIIRLTGLGFSQRDIMASCGIAQKTVVKAQKRAIELNLCWPLEELMTDIELDKLMFPKEDTTRTIVISIAALIVLAAVSFMAYRLLLALRPFGLPSLQETKPSSQSISIPTPNT